MTFIRQDGEIFHFLEPIYKRKKSIFPHFLEGGGPSSDVTSATLKACLGVLPVIVILGLWEYSRKCYTMFVGVLPQKWSKKALGVLPY